MRNSLNNLRISISDEIYNDILKILKGIEEIRFSLNSLNRDISGIESVNFRQNFLNNIRTNIYRIIYNEKKYYILCDIKYVGRPYGPKGGADYLDANIPNCAKALALTLAIIEKAMNSPVQQSLFADLIEANIGRLNEIVPSQKIAPAQFEVRDGRIHIVKSKQRQIKRIAI